MIKERGFFLSAASASVLQPSLPSFQVIRAEHGIRASACRAARLPMPRAGASGGNQR
jgi:hypothetical protein